MATRARPRCRVASAAAAEGEVGDDPLAQRLVVRAPAAARGHRRIALAAGHRRPAVLDRSSTTRTRPSSARDVATLTVARLTTNAVYRFAPPFLATIARGLDVELSRPRRGAGHHRALRPGLPGASVASSTALPRRLVDGQRPGRHRRRRGVAGPAPGVVMFAVGLLRRSRWARSCSTSASARGSPTTCRTSGGAGWSGMTETSWALGLLVGVSALGLVTAAIVVALGLRRRRVRRRRRWRWSCCSTRLDADDRVTTRRRRPAPPPVTRLRLPPRLAGGRRRCSA